MGGSAQRTGNVIDKSSLAHRILVLSGRIANIVPSLSSANIGTGDGLVGLNTESNGLAERF